MAYDRLLQLLTLSCSASVQMLQCGSELPSSLTELLSNSTGGWLQKYRLQSLFGWSWNSIFSAKSSNPLRFFKLSSSLCFIPPHPSIIRMLPNQSLPELCKIFIFKQLEKKNMRVILLCNDQQLCSFTIPSIDPDLLSRAVKYRHPTDWMDLEKHHELMWIKESVSCNQERKIKSHHQD